MGYPTLTNSNGSTWLPARLCPSSATIPGHPCHMGGLLPGWAKEGIKPQINARSETAATKPFFRHAFKSGRCLVTADGWYEWQVTASGKAPHCIHHPNGEIFYMAGLMEGQKNERTYCILTTAAHDSLAWQHSRMPVILPDSALQTWLDPTANRDALERLLLPIENWEAYPVSRLVNTPKNDTKDCIKPA